MTITLVFRRCHGCFIVTSAYLSAILKGLESFEVTWALSAPLISNIGTVIFENSENIPGTLGILWQYTDWEPLSLNFLADIILNFVIGIVQCSLFMLTVVRREIAVE